MTQHRAMHLLLTLVPILPGSCKCSNSLTFPSAIPLVAVSMSYLKPMSAMAIGRKACSTRNRVSEWCRIEDPSRACFNAAGP